MKYVVWVLGVLLAVYTVAGASHRVEEIKARAPEAIEERNWEILRYEGYQRGAWANHGGKVWYHTKDLGNDNTYYRVRITLWGGELHFHYGQPERLHRLNFDKR